MRRRYYEDDYYSNPFAFILSGFLVLLLEKAIFSFLDYIRNRRIEKAKREQIINNYNNEIKAKLIKGEATNEEAKREQFNMHCNFLNNFRNQIEKDYPL